MPSPTTQRHMRTPAQRWRMRTAHTVLIHCLLRACLCTPGVSPPRVCRLRHCPRAPGNMPLRRSWPKLRGALPPAQAPQHPQTSHSSIPLNSWRRTHTPVIRRYLTQAHNYNLHPQQHLHQQSQRRGLGQPQLAVRDTSGACTRLRADVYPGAHPRLRSGRPADPCSRVPGTGALPPGPSP